MATSVMACEPEPDVHASKSEAPQRILEAAKADGDAKSRSCSGSYGDQSQSDAQSEVWVQPACTETCENASMKASGSHQDFRATATPTSALSSDEAEEDRLSSSHYSRSATAYVSFEDVGARVRSASREIHPEEILGASEPRKSIWRRSIDSTHQFFGQLSCVRSREPDRGNLPAPRRHRWRQCFRNADDDSKDREIETLRAQLIAEARDRMYAEEEVKKLQETVDRYRKMVDIAVAQRKTCSKLLKQSLDEKEELESQLEHSGHRSGQSLSF